MLNVAIYTGDFPWAGGVDLLHGMVKGLLAQKKQECKIFILVQKERLSLKSIFWGIPGSFLKALIKLLQDPVSLKKITLAGLLYQTEKKIDYDNFKNIIEIFSKEDVQIIYYNTNSYKDKLKALQKIKADIIFPSLGNSFSPDFPVSWIGYVFDFAYKHFSHLYTEEFCRQTDNNFYRTLQNAKAVIVNSKQTADDIKRFMPSAKAKVFHLPFAPYANESVYNAASSFHDIKEKYGLKQPYFIISNQFWLHKSHETAFLALKILRSYKLSEDIELVCTGRMTDLSGTDDRKNELVKFIKELGIENHIYFLGHIPKVHQLALMMNSVSVIQPTLSEGGPGGGAVYMAVANGVPAIVSDIAVNKEIENEPLISFFEVTNARDLADRMEENLRIGRKIVEYSLLEEKNKQRMMCLGNTLIDSIRYTLSGAVELRKQGSQLY